MAKRSQRRKPIEQHIAVFGESGSGKTVLLSSFYGPTQELAFKQSHEYQIAAVDAGQRNQLHQNYLGMRDKASAPPPTRFDSKSYEFSVRLKRSGQGNERPTQSQHALSLVWHDYPGEWFEQSASGDEEHSRRLRTFRSLLSSDVAFLLVDGQKLLEHKDEEGRYLKSLFANIRNGLESLRDELLGQQGPLVSFPRIWVLALSKADLLPELDAYSFRDLVVRTAGDDLTLLRESIAELVSGDAALSVGEDFLLLSSARFEPEKIDVSKPIGLDLILPLAAVLPFQRHVRWREAKALPTKVASELINSSGAFLGAIGPLIRKVPLRGFGPVGAALSLIPTGLLEEVATLSGDSLKRVHENAVAKHNSFAAVLTEFVMRLEQGERDQVFLRSTH